MYVWKIIKPLYISVVSKYFIVMRIVFYFFIFCVFIGFSSGATAQTDYYKEIGKMDLSKLWRTDSLFIFEHNYNDDHELIIANPHNVVFPEPLGYIDTGYQRFCIHYFTVTKSPTDPYKYMVTGKTKIKDVVSTFTGTITIKKALLLKVQEFPTLQRGTVYAEYKFIEDPKKPTSGVLAGKMQTNWYLNKDHALLYDNIDAETNGYRNSQYTGTWTGNKNKKVKKCNWGDYRIPASGPLDIGVEEFSIKDRYLKNGWQNYATAHWGADPVQQAKAKEIESVEWWK